ncbi:Clathrin adaptor complex small chain [Babesia microti strain RI]|uniref:AP complex subunit sigma n=1 Tax=Babesia microti (strain RI) TaxID=1133968 RepID=I7IGG8_BABMR|nr:Clathrin adaptor complex small chain [Babesia microti strain RI]CCF73836.1 Clathrin adaptor complex small chain [Babesia microti strain RI]|eukprot:XP_012648445.1 Clathrin adaptor complex small chain [Babesia microti strain RI]
MIRVLLFQNMHGDTRLSKWYINYSLAERRKIEKEIYQIVIRRQKKWSNAIEYNGYKLVYRQYAGLIICACIDPNENPLAIFEMIHLFVEIMDLHFGDVCELDIVYNFIQVHALLDEFILAGSLAETCKNEVVARAKKNEKL